MVVAWLGTEYDWDEGCTRRTPPPADARVEPPTARRRCRGAADDRDERRRQERRKGLSGEMLLASIERRLGRCGE